jgi:hypothetical protein
MIPSLVTLFTSYGGHTTPVCFRKNKSLVEVVAGLIEKLTKEFRCEPKQKKIRIPTMPSLKTWDSSMGPTRATLLDTESGSCYSFHLNTSSI